MSNIQKFSEDANGLYPRVLEGPIERDLTLYPVVAIMGARQVGKSTLARKIAASRGMAYRTLDDAYSLAQAREDAAGFLADLGNDGALIDEVQRAPGLFLAVKAVVDLDQRKGQYLLSGSSQPEIQSGVGDSLVGRANYRTLRPLTTNELRFSAGGPAWSDLFGEESETLRKCRLRAELNGDLDWQQVASVGGFPRVVGARPDAVREVVDSYITTFMTRDLPEILDVASPSAFERFVRLLAVRTGQPLNYQGMAADLGVATNTLRRWFGVLERTYLVELIPAFHVNAGHRVIKTPKAYLADSALALVASGERELTGFHLENLLAVDLKVWSELRPGRRIYHWRVQGGAEADFILEEDGDLVAVEIKSSPSVGTSDARHLHRFIEDHGAKRGVVLSCDPEIRMLGPKVLAAPWWVVV